MADVEIHAASAILGLNVDRDSRTLPSKPVAGASVGGDHTRPTRTGGDDELLMVEVRIAKSALEMYERLLLRIRGDADPILLDDTRRPMTQSGAFEYELPREAGTHRFHLEASEPPSPQKPDSGAFTLTAYGIAGGEETALAARAFRVAPLLFLGDDAPVVAVYMAHCPDNGPAIRDVRDAIGTKLRLIARKDCASDAWIQDQFQLAAVVTPRRAMPTLVHMPRVGKNAAINTDERNLSQVVRSHFPSRNLGVIQDLWDRTVEVVDGEGMQLVRFEDTLRILRAFKSISLTGEHLTSVVKRLSELLGRKRKKSAPPTTVTDALYGLRQLEIELDAIANEAAAKLPHEDLAELVKTAKAKVRDAFAHATYGFGHVRLSWMIDGKELSYVMPDSDAGDLWDRLELIHDSVTYGGNIEVSPPHPGAPFGMVVIGTSQERPMDPDVRKMFGDATSLQPVIEVDTSWLAVAHVDELISFMPGTTPVIFRAAPEIARRLMIVAASLYAEDGDDLWDKWHPLIDVRHDMHRGTHPMTRMFRGKMWLHEHPVRESQWPGSDATISGAEPPNIYLKMYDWHSRAGPGSPVRYHFGSKTRRDYYPAKMSIYELMYFETCFTNRLVDKRLESLDQQLRSELPRFPIRKVPVLFDDEMLTGEECANQSRALSVGATTALTPNMVNLQLVDDVVLVPNPFGPRMALEDAAKVVRSVLREEKLDSIANMVTPEWFEKQHLHTVKVWISRRQDEEGYEQTIRSITQIADEFQDSFPLGTPPAARVEAIRKANLSAFGPKKLTSEEDPKNDWPLELRDGWHHLTIPGTKSVDLFQAYTHALIVAQGKRPAWIDAWYYHVRHGEIHCGTNALRRVPAGWGKWWA
ncbi:MAG TPA: protein-arginine deiminase family protein [Thermoanaerobaculia bacterium]|nr:protein-arginine deiminase family protein [Thermoanaerobaculia bacterium]